MRRLVFLTAVTTAATVVLSLGGPGALLPLKNAAQALTDVSVAFVVDFSGSEGVQSACIKVPSTDNEYQALALFTEQEHEAAPTYNSSGLLCSIGGVPSSGCGQAEGNGYIYWSYWHGDSGSWQYSNTGASGIVHSCDPAGNDCDVEGWKFEDPGAGNASDPPPRSPPDYAAICSSGPASTTTSTATPSTVPGTTSASTPSNSAAGSGGDTTGSPGPSKSEGTAVTTPSENADVTPASLAVTGPGAGIRWAAGLGFVLAILGIGVLAVDARARRARSDS